MNKRQNGLEAKEANVIVAPFGLNSADEETLAVLAPIGVEKARVLVQFRPYEYWSDLRRLPGFSAADIEAIRAAGAELDPPS